MKTRLLNIYVTVTLYLVVLISRTHADFQCYCSYSVEKTVYSLPDRSVPPLGYMYEFDCKPAANGTPPQVGFNIVQFEHKLGYIEADAQVQLQTCPGSPSATDVVPTTVATNPPSSSSPLTTRGSTSQAPTSSAATPSSSSIARTTTTVPTTRSSSSTKSPFTPSTHPTSTALPTSTTTRTQSSTRHTPSFGTMQSSTMPSSITTASPTTHSTISSTTTHRTTTSTVPTKTSTVPTTTPTVATATSTVSTLATTVTTINPWSFKANVSNTPLQYVGVGYNVLTGNPSFPQDPGLLLNKRILQLNGTSAHVVEADITLRQTCASHTSWNLVHGSNSLQSELKTYVAISDSHPVRLSDYAFLYNSDVGRNRRDLESGQHVYHDSVTTCSMGHANYHGNGTVPFGNFTISREFALAVCQLPMFNMSSPDYDRFLDEWGTSVVLGAELGTKTWRRSSETLPDLFMRIQSVDASLLQHSGRFNGFSSSWVINDQIYKTSAALHNNIHQSVLMSVGSSSNPAPISLNVVPITDVISMAYFKPVLDNLVEEGTCPDSIYDNGLDTLSNNVGHALNNYHQHQQHLTSFTSNAATDCTLQVPVTWPHGTYGLMKTASGCPGAGVTWYMGWRFQDTEDRNANNQFTAGITRFLAGEFGSNNIKTEFCIKPQAQVTSFDVEWGRGSYCILKKGNCPSGFQVGSIQWDDEDSNNGNKAGGTLPDGSFDANTRVDYCCRNDGSTTTPLVLPTDRPFVLLSYERVCQTVYGMLYTKLFLQWDDEDTHTGDHADGMHPLDDGSGNNHYLHFCYYQANSQPGIIG